MNSYHLKYTFVLWTIAHKTIIKAFTHIIKLKDDFTTCTLCFHGFQMNHPHRLILNVNVFLTAKWKIVDSGVAWLRERRLKGKTSFKALNNPTERTFTLERILSSGTKSEPPPCFRWLLRLSHPAICPMMALQCLGKANNLWQ